MARAHSGACSSRHRSIYNYGAGTLTWDPAHPVPVGGTVGAAGVNLTFTPGATGPSTFSFDFATLTYWVE